MSTPTRRRPDASMTLLVEMMERPLDPGYAAAADRRRAQGRHPATGERSPTLVLTAVLIGFLLVVAALTLRPPGTSASREKAQLVGLVDARRAHGDEQVDTINALRTEIRALQAAAPAAPDQAALTAEATRLELLTGQLAAGGPGLVLTLDDAPAAARGDGSVDPRQGSGFAEGRVSALDLQTITNGLWQAGAEAIAVNGQRLTARSAIRFAGEAILVDYRPLTRPYLLSVIGEPAQLQARFAATPAGAYLKALGDNYRIPSTVRAQDNVVVPRSPTLGLSLARPVPTGIPSTAEPSAPTTTRTNP